MIATEEATELAGTSRVPIYVWIKRGRCIGAFKLRCGFKPAALAVLVRYLGSALQPITKSVGN